MNLQKQLEFSGHNAAVYSLAFDGTFLYSGSADSFVARWDLTLGVQDKFAIKADAPVYAVATANAGKLLLMGLSTGAIHIIDVLEKKELRFIQQHPSAVFYIIENPIKKHVYSSDASGNLAVWNAGNFDLLLFIPVDCGKIRRIVVSTDGESIVLCCQDGNIRVLDTTFFNETHNFYAHENGTNSGTFIGSNLLLSGGKDAMFRLWNLDTKEVRLEIPAHNFAIYDLVFMNGLNKVISCSRDKTIKVWNVEDLSIDQRIDRKVGGHFHSVNAICEMDKHRFATCSDDKRIVVWKIGDN
jgi:WD40 repeat protein